MLDPAFKAKWLADLRSGVYPKTKGHLKDGLGFEFPDMRPSPHHLLPR